jgi:hypothetical protein
MDFKFECTHCQQHMQVDVKHSGRQIECPACHHLIRIPAAPGLAKEEFNPQSGMTWNTYVPGSKEPGK